MAPPAPPDAAKEIEMIKGLVAKHFPVYDVRVNYDVVQFFCRVEEATLEDSFERLREDMQPHGYIPMITYEKGEHVIIVGKKPPTKYKSIYVNVVMLVITFLAMMYAGVLDWTSYADVPTNEMWSAENVGTGILVFALPLMAILAVHELGHFFMAKKRKVAASLPFFIPSIPPLGTFGAFISLRDPIPNRKTLLEIGVAGPLAGMIMALPIGIAGLLLTNAEARPIPDEITPGGLVQVGFPLVYQWLESLFPISGDYLLHPTAFAAWVGFLVTALNLLPVGQLDGGHIARALLGPKAKYSSWIAIVIMIGLSYFYLGWVIFAILILFLGAKHPPPLNDINKLDLKRQLVGVFAFIVLIVAFVPIPMSPVLMDYSYEITPTSTTYANITPGEATTFTVLLSNLGNTWNNITFEKMTSPADWDVTFKQHGESDEAYREAYSFRVNTSVNVTVDIGVRSSINSITGQASVTITAFSEAFMDDTSQDKHITYIFNVTRPMVTFWTGEPTVTIPPPGGEDTITVYANNTDLATANLTLSIRELPAYVGAYLFLEDYQEPNASTTLNLSVAGESNITFGVQVFVWDTAVPGERMILIDAYFQESLVATIEILVVVT